MASQPQSDLRDVVRRAFLATHDGHNTDDVVIDDALNRPFIAAKVTTLEELFQDRSGVWIGRAADLAVVPATGQAVVLIILTP
jgi:hypothetical protein